jgi:hypothetical protein
MNGETSWLPGVLVLAGGLSVGLVLAAWALRRRGALAGDGRAALLARRDELVGQLREVQQAAGRLPAGELDTDLRALELQTAEVLRQLDRPVVPARAASPRGRSPGNRALAGVAIGLAVATAIVLLQRLASESAVEKQPRAASARPRLAGKLPEGHPPTSKVPAGHPAVGSARLPGAAPAAAAPGPTGVSGTIELAAAAVPEGSVLFLYARTDGARSGPPLAVKRIVAPQFPLPFSLGPEDSMMGASQWPPSATVEARLDRDGSVTSKDPGDPIARMDGLLAGAAGVRLVLR